jgi:hypothetical protein
MFPLPVILVRHLFARRRYLYLRGRSIPMHFLPQSSRIAGHPGARRWMFRDHGRPALILSYLSADLELFARHDLSREVWGGPGLRRAPCFGPGRSPPTYGLRFRDNSVVCIIATARTVVLLLSGALASCATGPSPQRLDARAGCRQQWEATSNPPPTTVSDTYIDQCMATTHPAR